MKVVLVDDDNISGYTTSLLVKKYHPSVEFIHYERAEDALDALRKADKMPDIMLIDLNMPVMDGWEFLKHLENEFLTDLADTRCLVLSSSVNPEDHQRAKRCHLVHDFIVKPLEKDGLGRLFA